MTPSQTAIAAAPIIRDGLVANSDNPAAFWLELFNALAGFCEASIGEAASRQVIGGLNAACGVRLQ